MQAMMISNQPPGRTGIALMEALPDPVHKPPGRAPGEPIIIKDPLRSPEVPEIDRPLDEEDDEPEIKKPPGIIPEKRPPPAPWERADRPAPGLRRYLEETAGRP